MNCRTMSLKCLQAVVVVVVLVQPRECFIDSLLRDIKSGLETAGREIQKGVNVVRKEIEKVGCKVGTWQNRYLTYVIR